MTSIVDVEQNSVSYLLSLANDMRRAKNDALLEDLPKSVPQEPESCLVANAFNYGCSVDPGTELISFRTTEDRDTYLQVVQPDISGWVFEDDFDEHDPEHYELRVMHKLDAPMTQELIDIAEAFDSGAFEDYVAKPEFDYEPEVW